MAEAHGSHDETLLQLLKRARECNIKLNRNKMRLRMTELLYIGHRISEKGIRLDPAKVMAVKAMAAPNSTTDIKRFLGMCNYLSCFIPKLSQTSEPLRCLTENNIDFRWGTSEQTAFDKVKELISEDQLLAFYDVTKPVVIQCDASGEGQGATLLREGRPVTSAFKG